MSKVFRRRETVTCETPDGVEVEVDLVVDMRDQGKYERARRHLNLPKVGDEGMLSFAMGSAYFALKRAKSPIVEGTTLEQWIDDRCIDVTPLDKDGEPATDPEAAQIPVDPTNLEAPPG